MGDQHDPFIERYAGDPVAPAPEPEPEPSPGPGGEPQPLAARGFAPRDLFARDGEARQSTFSLFSAQASDLLDGESSEDELLPA